QRRPPRQHELDEHDQPHRGLPARTQPTGPHDQQAEQRHRRALRPHQREQLDHRPRRRAHFLSFAARSASAILRSIARSSARDSDSSSTRFSTSEPAWPSNTSRTNSRSRSRSTDSRRCAGRYTNGSRALSTTTARLVASRPSSVMTVVYASSWPRLPSSARTSATVPVPTSHSAFMTRSSAAVRSGERVMATTLPYDYYSRSWPQGGNHTFARHSTGLAPRAFP